MNLGITAEEAAYLLTLIKEDIWTFGGIDKIKEKKFAKKIDFDSLIKQLQIIAIIGDKAEEVI